MGVKINCTLPSETANFQKVKNTEYSINPSQIVTDEHNNTVAIFSIPHQQANITISIISIIELEQLEFRQSSPIFQYNKTSQIFQEYTKQEIYIESDAPKIRELAYDITANSSNALESSKLICEWVNENLNHTGYAEEERGALWALENGTGDCSEFSHLFIALCRAVGIPSRFVNGISLWSFLEDGIQEWNEVGHDWAEVYFPDVGWVWVDPVSNEFGCSDGKHLALQHGQHSSSIEGNYRYRYIGASKATEMFEIYTVE